MDWWLQHGAQEWGAFMSAPVICLSFLIIGGLFVWWMNRAEKRAMEQRLSLAQEQSQAATKKASETKEAFVLLSKQVANQASLTEIAATVASVGISMDELMRAQWRVSQSIQTSSGLFAPPIRPDDL